MNVTDVGSREAVFSFHSLTLTNGNNVTHCNAEAVFMSSSTLLKLMVKGGVGMKEKKA